MSMFDSRSQAQYAASLLKFLRVSQECDLKETGVSKLDSGQESNNASSDVRALERLANIKAARCEAADSTMGERIKLARDYVGLSNIQVSRRMGVSLEFVEQWVNGLHLPNNGGLMKLAEVLTAPVEWLQQGGEVNLPFDSHLGARFGDESMKFRETLFSMTLNVLEKVANSEDSERIADALNTALQTNIEMCNVARKAGGRWGVKDGQLLFVPWVLLEFERVKR